MSAIFNKLRKRYHIKTNSSFKPIILVRELSLKIAEIKSSGFVTCPVFHFTAFTGYFLSHFPIW